MKPPTLSGKRFRAVKFVCLTAALIIVGCGHTPNVVEVTYSCVNGARHYDGPDPVRVEQGDVILFRADGIDIEIDAPERNRFTPDGKLDLKGATGGSVVDKAKAWSIKHDAPKKEFELLDSSPACPHTGPPDHPPIVVE